MQQPEGTAPQLIWRLRSLPSCTAAVSTRVTSAYIRVMQTAMFPFMTASRCTVILLARLSSGTGRPAMPSLMPGGKTNLQVLLTGWCSAA